MKKALILFSAMALFGCQKDEVTKSNTPSECKCGVIQQTMTQYDNGVLDQQAILYNNCSSEDTTINYIPETSAGHQKEKGEPHCLGVAW